MVDAEVIKKLRQYKSEIDKAKVNRFKEEFKLGLWKQLPKGKFEWIRRK